MFSFLYFFYLDFIFFLNYFDKDTDLFMLVIKYTFTINDK